MERHARKEIEVNRLLNWTVDIVKTMNEYAIK